MAKATVKRGGENLTFRIGKGIPEHRGMSLHMGLLKLNLDKQYADMTMREIAEGLAEYYNFKSGEIEFAYMAFAKRELTKKKG